MVAATSRASGTGAAHQGGGGRDSPAAGTIPAGSGPAKGNKESDSSVMLLKREKGRQQGRYSPAPLGRKQQRQQHPPTAKRQRCRPGRAQKTPSPSRSPAAEWAGC